jgi:transcriptional regulator of acetoin/glycerol metabolism
LEEALDANKWDTAKVAAALGIHRATVYRQMKRHALAPPE